MSSSELQPAPSGGDLQPTKRQGRLPATVSKIAAVPRTVRHPATSLKHFWSSASDEPDVFEEMTLAEHLMDLRNRIVRSAIAVGLAFVVGLFLSKAMLRLIQRQANIKDGFQILSPTEPFTDYLKMAMYIAVVIASPILLWQFFGFVAPGMTRKEKRYVFLAIPFVIVLFVTGAGFAFFVAAPAAFHVLSGFGGNLFKWNPQGQEVIRFYQTMMIGLGLAFELPVLMLILAKTRILNWRRQAAAWRYAIVLIMIASAIITPTPDPYNMMIIATPLTLLYFFGLGLARYL
jgi:sec-independent protein translocase protein TatC